MIEIIKKMQKEVSERSPKYGMRKLSVGLVSCFLGYAIISNPTAVNAQVIEGTSADSELRYIQEDIQRHKTNTVVSNSTDNEVMNKDNVNNTKVIENSQSTKPNPAPKLGNRNMVTNSNYSMDGSSNLGNRNLEISANNISSPVKASQNNKVEKIVTYETKTPDNRGKVGNIDGSVLNSEGNFVGKEDGSVSLGGNKDITSKEDLDKEKTVYEFNNKYRSEKTGEIKEGIEKERKDKKEQRLNLVTEMNDHYQSRAEEFLRDLETEFKDDIIEMRKLNADWAFVAENDVVNRDNDPHTVIEPYYSYNLIKGQNYYERSSNYKRHRREYINADYNKEEIKDEYWENLRNGHIKFEKNQGYLNGGLRFLFAYKDGNYSDGSKLKEYIENNNIIERFDKIVDEFHTKNYEIDVKKLEEINLKYEKSKKEDDELWSKYINSYDRTEYAKIKEESLRPKNIEIIEDPTIWEGNFKWERYSKDGYIRTLIQNGEEVAKRVVHPLVGIKRVGTKTEEVRERREVESSTYDVIERPTTDSNENGKVIQEGSDGLVEKVYDATYDKFSNVIKKELKDTVVKKEKKDRIVLKYGIKEETKTPVTLYDGIKNYDTDEKKIKDYSEKERYKTTDLQPGNVNQELYKNDQGVEKDGFKFELKNPSKTSPSKTEYGWQITIDKEKGQRTYTNIYVSDVGLTPVESGNKPMMNDGEKLTSESSDTTYKPSEDTIITASNRQRDLNYDASEETLKHINNKDNSFTSFGMKDNYTQDNPRNKFFEGNFFLSYWVNPWPNENDKLEELKLSKTYDKKEYVKGQLIKTDIRISNLDESAKERIVGQIYNSATGEVVKEANAYLGDDGYVYIKMPDGVINEDGSENKDSIFNKPEYKGLQNLDVKFFARPRTKDEFAKIAKTPDGSGDIVTYTETGAGSKFINHKGREVEVDLQGIDRYDHYNLIGSFKLQLDDTRYYDQNFIGSDKEDTSKHTAIPILPGQDFTAKVYLPEDKKDNPYQKSDLDIKDGAERAILYGKLDKKFI